ncbi:para-aminobenzoic acid synthetase [Epithele typhae]|uniref:para-aminobenzoic acid synthetase n=1 Tax=Epithele typhae TaxID=378194 RepID=UPI002008127C|nr:para-aminobenzoic acid synthetase [Epithele typhae]KAH9944166.1 para-aminobenzoic acid synthetase [Epithele typhae]
MPRILLIDSYDSFTHKYNSYEYIFSLAALCKRAIPGSFVHIIKNDELSPLTLLPLLSHFDAVIVGPGPGSPDNLADVGVLKALWHLSDEHLLPVFGVCLGLQSLAFEYGGEVRRLRVVKHGQISTIQHFNTSIFQDAGEVCAVRYHSLHIVLSGSEDLVPLAWADDGEENGKVLMAVKHVHKPFYAVQYHPESVKRKPVLAKDWSSRHARSVRPWDFQAETSLGPSWPRILPRSNSPPATPATVAQQTLRGLPLDLVTICDMLGVDDENANFVVLDSAAAPGRFSIIGCLSPQSPRITHSISAPFVQVRRGTVVDREDLEDRDIWSWLNQFMQRRKAVGGIPEVPFWGGLVGYLSYELGVCGLTSLKSYESSVNRHPDMNLVFVERSIVVDTHSGAIHVQSIAPSDRQWLDSMVVRLKHLPAATLVNPQAPPEARTPRATSSTTTVHFPDRQSYISKIEAAQEQLFAGESYELCVTAPTHITIPKPPSAHESSSSWARYKTLRSRNPAPHSAYIRLHPSTLLSSSPERFLSYGRPPYGLCQLRPIKGTVRKAPGITRSVAEEMLSGSIKEVAENLMIVDLIRHDLHGAVGEDVEVKQFCVVEEYETVWQLVSVIEGCPSSPSRDGSELGFMTGAPKKRSVEILQHLEGRERGIYSGVLGYADVGGGGDWAVTIRSCFKYDDLSQRSTDPTPTPLSDATNNPTPLNGLALKLSACSSTRTHADSTLGIDPLCHDVSTETWTLGAGGAITALSEPVAEWDEMLTKVQSVLRAFDVTDCY